MGRPHWTASDSEIREYYNRLAETDIGDLRVEARRAEQQGDYSYAQDLYRVAGDTNSAREMGSRAADRYCD